MKQNTNRRSGIRIMAQLIGLVRPLLHIMLIAIFFGVMGYLCAISLTIIAGKMILVENLTAGKKALFILLLLAVLRGVFHYAEQYCNHFIAFKLLAIIRHQVFAALRNLCPAKLEGKDRGNLISVITTDIELLEVFYAHTISPIAIAVTTCGIMLSYFYSYHILAAVLAFFAYAIVGILIPLWNGKMGAASGMAFREKFGNLNSFVLDSLRGLEEILQYKQGEKRASSMEKGSKDLSYIQRDLSAKEGTQRAITNWVIVVSSIAMLGLCLCLCSMRQMPQEGVIMCTIAMMGSFGPVVALAGLSNNLHQTLASGERVLSILEEEPQVKEIEDSLAKKNNTNDAFTGVRVENVSFSYENEKILDKYSIHIQSGEIIGIHGASGSGKSTLLKLLMRFWDTDSGNIQISEEDIKKIPAKVLRDMESYVTQETHLFHDSIANNIAIGKLGASHEEIIEAAKKASIHEFITTLPQGYDTPVGELGETLSGGERQRIGIARAFLHDAPLLLLDEPTSNLDALNEGVILKSLLESCEKTTVILVSHRKSTLNFADKVYAMESVRKS
ncbi:MAG: ABC transporter ATP-binding protein [Lachnospiraceae bacterium]|nr:ABC transporter ATP-binding protein [Lachnospiraceae bacterium]